MSGNSNENEDNGKLSDLVEVAISSKRVKRFIKRFIKGFGSGLCVYTGFQIVTALLRNPYRKSLPKIRAGLLARDSFRFAAFLGLYPSVYELMVDVLERVRGKKEVNTIFTDLTNVIFTDAECGDEYHFYQDDWNSSLAGGIAGLGLAIEDPVRRRVYCLFAIARAIGALVLTLVKRGILPRVPFCETLLFSCCGSFVVYCTLLKPRYLLTGYYRSILKWSRHYTDTKMSILFRQPSDKFITCAEAGLHPQSCTRYAVADFVQSLPHFAKLYLPIHLAPTVLFNYKRLYRRPKQMLLWLTQNVFWSGMFLAATATVIKYTICLLRNLQHRPPPLSPWIAVAAGFSCGLGLLFERQNRRVELSLFMIPHTLYAIYLWSQDKKILPQIPYSTVALFAIAMVPIMHAYEREPESLTLLIHSTLKFFVGQRKHTVERQRTRGTSEMSV